MDQQIQQAVEIALSGTSDAGLKNQAFQFINDIKSTEEGFKTCVEILLNSSSKGGSLNAGLKFFIFQVIDENTERLSQEQLYALNTNLFKYLDDMIAINSNDEIYLRNKLSDLLGKLFCYVYPSLDVNFLKKFLLLSQSKNTLSIDYFMRTLISIHFEIGDRFLAREKESQNRNNYLKDLIRDRDMNSLVSSWKSVLNDVKDVAVLDNTLKVIGYYIDWMEISLFIHGGFLNVIYDFLKNPELRDQACLTLLEIMSKKMKPTNKLQLVNLLDLSPVIGSLKDDGLDFIENLAKLANQVGIELCIVLENGPNLIQEVSNQLSKLWPTVFEFLNHEYDDITQQVFPFIQHYLLISKKNSAVTSGDLLSVLLKNIIKKMKYDSDSDGFNDDDQFLEIRQKLKIFQDTIAVLNPQIYLEIVPSMIESSIFGNSSFQDNEGWNVVELGLYELSNFADSLKNNLINLPKAEISSSKPYRAVQDLLIKIINSFQFLNHPKNQLAFFELVIRHFSTKNFSNTTQTSMNDISLQILDLFSNYGLFNGVEAVRLRCWYLFFRFVNATKPSLNSYVLEKLLLKIQPLLAVKAELPTKDEDDDIVEKGDFNSQLYLFEALGMLVTLTDSPEACVNLVDVLLQPLFGSLEECISREDKFVNPLIPLQTHHLLFAIATIVKGLDTQAPGKSDTLKKNSELATIIGNAAQVVLISLENFNKFESVRDAARFAFARLVPIMSSQSSIHLSKLITLILASPNLKIQELGDFAGFVGQLVHQFKNDDTIFQLLNSLLTPMIQKIYETLSIEDVNYPNLVREKYILKRAYLSFLSILVLNNQFSLLLTETNKSILPQVLGSVVEYSCDLSDSMTTKAAITQFASVINLLGCNGGKLNDAADKYAVTVAPIDGIDQYLMESTVKLCFELPFRENGFDLKDAQVRNIASELSVILVSYAKRSSQQAFIQFLGNYLTEMGLDASIAKDFCLKLVELNVKDFKKYYVTFLGELKK